MALTPVKGKFAKLQWAGTDQPAVNWSIPITANVEDVSNFRDGRQRCATLEDADGITFQLIHDEAASTLGTIKPGTFGTLTCYTNAAQSDYYRLVCIVTQATANNQGVNATLKYDVTAGLHGTIQYPTN